MSLGNVFILGDSYSTFEGYIPPGYESWYYSCPLHDTDVDAVDKTWWKQLLDATGSRLLRNCSWSGTTICHTGYSGDCSDRSFISRFDRLVQDGYFEENAVDTVFLFGGTNDSWADSPVGELMYDSWEQQDLYSVLPAVGYLLHRVTNVLPEARVAFILNTDLKPSIADGIKTACAQYDVELVPLEAIAKQAGHPNAQGMGQIARQIWECLNR